MKTMFLAAAAMLCIGTGVAYADGVEDAGWVPNTWFTELPGEVSTAPGMPPNNVASNATQTAPQSTSWATPTNPAVPNGS